MFRCFVRGCERDAVRVLSPDVGCVAPVPVCEEHLDAAMEVVEDYTMRVERLKMGWWRTIRGLEHRCPLPLGKGENG